MKIRILTLTKTLEPRVAGLEEEYRTRLSRFVPVEFIEIKRETMKDPASFTKDWKRISEKIGNSMLVILDEKGKSFNSKLLAEKLDQWLLGGRDICFVVGGPEGFPEEIKKKADMLLSLSSLTLPHKLVRLFLIEALYRANDILRGGPYHRE